MHIISMLNDTPLLVTVSCSMALATDSRKYPCVAPLYTGISTVTVLLLLVLLLLVLLLLVRQLLSPALLLHAALLLLTQLTLLLRPEVCVLPLGDRLLLHVLLAE